MVLEVKVVQRAPPLRIIVSFMGVFWSPVELLAVPSAVDASAMQGCVNMRLDMKAF